MRVPQYILEFLWIILPYSVKTLRSILDTELFVTKIFENSWKLLLNAVTESFVLNVTGLLDPILKHIGKFRLRK